MDAYNTINDILVHLFNEIWELEKKAIITEEFKDITNNDMHIIEAIGVSGKTTMSVVAKKMKITAGSLTTAVNGLVNKKYVMRARGEELEAGQLHNSAVIRADLLNPWKEWEADISA